MKKIRKYDRKNKMKILFVTVLSLLIFSLFIFIVVVVYKQVNKEFVINKNSVLFDINNNIIRTDSDAFLKTKWNNNWFLDYKEEKHNLGNNVVVYNENNGTINLYGTFYEIKNKGEVIKVSDNTLIESSAISKFYKINDRKYLLIDSIITSNGLVTSQYLIVDIEKSGYAFYTNNVVNVKTIEPTTIKTSTYVFDVNNETLTFYDDSEVIDLKKILGSTNEYKNSETTLEGSVDSGSSNQENITNNIVNNSVNEIINNVNINSNIDVQKRTSIIGATTSLDSINISYVVYDPRNEYESIFVLVNGEKYDINKNLNSVIIDSLIPNTTYKLEFKYTYYLDGVLKENIFEQIDVTTKPLDLEIQVNKIASNKIYYKVNGLQNIDYTVVLYYLENEEQQRFLFSKDSTYVCLQEYADSCKELESGKYMIKLENIIFNGVQVVDDIYYKFNY